VQIWNISWKHEPWTDEEDEKLLDLIRKSFHGSFPGPKDPIPSTRYSRILKRKPEDIRERWKYNIAPKLGLPWLRVSTKQHKWTVMDDKYLLVKIAKREPRKSCDIRSNELSKTWAPRVVCYKFRQLLNTVIDSRIKPLQDVLVELLERHEISPQDIKKISQTESFKNW